MYWRGVSSLAAVPLLGCASERTGADYAAMTQKVGPPIAGQARIVVLREKGFSGIGDLGWDVKLDGGPLSDPNSGTDRPANVHEIAATASLFQARASVSLRYPATRRATEPKS